MIVLNTTFVLNIPRSQHSAFINWIRKVYVPAAMATGIFSNPLLTRIDNADPNAATAFALHLHADDDAEARRWHDTTASMLRDNLHEIWPGENSVFPFTTYLNVVDLQPEE